MVVEALPYRHLVAAVSEEVDAEVLRGIYASMLSPLDSAPSEPHNVLLTGGWMMVIPRRTARIDEISANGAAMLGMVWCDSEAQYDGWMRRGVGNVLTQMGKPKAEMRQGGCGGGL